MWKMMYICGKWKVSEKRLKNVRNDVDIWEMLKYVRNGLNISQTA